MKPDAIGIKVTDGLIDIDDDRPFRGPKSVGVDKFDNDIMERGLQVNKIPNKTTVSDFVTHEPYDRQSSTQRKKSFINEAMAEIKASSPDMTATELKIIKAELLKQPSNKSSVRKTGQGCETERQDQTSHKEFEHACEQGRRDLQTYNTRSKGSGNELCTGSYSQSKKPGY